jgi:hypothetical protein
MTAKKYICFLVVVVLWGTSGLLFSQTPPSPEKKVEEPRNVENLPPGPPQLQPGEVERHEVIVPSGTRIPLSMVNFVSSRTARAGDPVYLETMFPTTVGNRVIIPIGSYVRGTITEVNRSARVKGRAEMYVRFDSLTLPNGTTRDFNATLSQADARVPGALKEGKIEAEGTKGRDIGTIAGTAAAGTSIGAIAGASSGHAGVGTAIGAGAGALAGLIIALSSRGHEIDLYRGTEVDMTLDRNLVFDESELAGMQGADRDRYLDRPGPPGRDPARNDRYGNRRWPY